MDMSLAAVSISAGRAHSCAMLRKQASDGAVEQKVFMWGSGVDGRLGTGSQEDQPYPVEVHINEGDVLAVSLGFDHSVFITSS